LPNLPFAPLMHFAEVGESMEIFRNHRRIRRPHLWTGGSAAHLRYRRSWEV